MFDFAANYPFLNRWNPSTSDALSASADPSSLGRFQKSLDSLSRFLPLYLPSVTILTCSLFLVIATGFAQSNANSLLSAHEQYQMLVRRQKILSGQIDEQKKAVDEISVIYQVYAPAYEFATLLQNVVPSDSQLTEYSLTRDQFLIKVQAASLASINEMAALLRSMPLVQPGSVQIRQIQQIAGSSSRPQSASATGKQSLNAEYVGRLSPLDPSSRLKLSLQTGAEGQVIKIQKYLNASTALEGHSP